MRSLLLILFATTPVSAELPQSMVPERKLPQSMIPEAKSAFHREFWQGYGWVENRNGVWWKVPESEVSAPRPFPVGGTRVTSVPSVGDRSTLFPDTMLMGRTTIGARLTGLSGGTNC